MKKHGQMLALLVSLSVLLLSAPLMGSAASPASTATYTHGARTTTPIQHLVVIFQENVSFDHYFGTYPIATNPAGEPNFSAKSNTPGVNGLSPALLTNNPNAANPKRLDRSQALTCDMDHTYTDEQKSFDHGLMDKFVEFASGGGCTDKSIVMNYYDGNTVTGLWNYAQAFSMSDNSYGTNFGPSTVGAENLIAGQTHGATPATLPGAVSNGTIIGDPRPAFDDCSTGATVSLSGKNVGDLLNQQSITWGWFQGGFRPSATSNGKAVCGTSHKNVGGATVTDFIPHHEPFQYYQSTSNPHHLPPTSATMIGKTDQANHQYDLQDFWTSVDHHNMPAVSFLKAPGYQDGHAGYSDPLDEQTFLVNTLNSLQKTPEWAHTAVVIAYDDSDGWYDHVMGPIVNQSNDPNDALTGPGSCGTAKAGAYQARCGYGPRLPLLVISPFARKNSVDHSITDQSSILRFIEDNWSLGRIGDQSFDAEAGTLNNLFNFHNEDSSRLFLNPTTGEPIDK
ncbi:MAG TPA: alkaline phosphatase family protein [Ktedonobacteraceae bacterium]|nr:alkaline phosphatase family protein [Ktedonobacteraceae bacterium]